MSIDKAFIYDIMLSADFELCKYGCIMFSILIAIIYLSFISLGLPDSLLGSAWPIMHSELSIPVSYAGIITMIISGCTIISSLASDRMTKNLGAGTVTLVSVFMTAAALFGFSVSNNFTVLCLFAIPYGLGAGAVDAALNNYVALNYSSRHMNWLHCFWGIGASISPYIMSFALTSGAGWRSGYRYVSIIQTAITVIIFISLPLWKKRDSEVDMPKKKSAGLKGALSIDGVWLVLVTFLAYCSLEGTAGLWATSYLTDCRGIAEEAAAEYAAYFYLGITFGRLLCGFFSERIGDRRIILIGIFILSAGIISIMLPSASALPASLGLIVVGLGCAPIYPAIIHSTPNNFGKENSQAVIGIQMASAYIGSTFMPPLFGALSKVFGMALYPYYLAIFAVLMLVTSEALVRRKKRISA